MSTPQPQQTQTIPQAPQVPQQAPVQPQQPKRRTPSGNGKARNRILDMPPPPVEWDHPITATTALAAAGSVAYYLDAAPWWVIASGSALTLSTTAINAKRFERPVPPTGEKTRTEYQTDRPITSYTFVCAGAATAYAAYAAEFSPWSPAAAGMLAGFAAVLGPVYAYLRGRNEKNIVAEIAQRAEQRTETTRNQWEQLIADSGLEDVWIDRNHNTDDGWKAGTKEFPSGVSLMLVLGRKAPKFDFFIGSLGDLEKNAASLPGVGVIRSGSFQASQPGGQANRVELTIPTGDVLSQLVPAPLENGPRSINDTLYTGRAVDGTAIGVNLKDNPHGMITGITDAGKSNYLNGHLYESTRCTDSVDFAICGPAKAKRLFKPWLRPWLKGEVDAPPLDWIAPSWDEAMNMLCDVYRAIGVRQGLGGIDDIEDKWQVTDEQPRICLWIDEPPEFLKSDRTRIAPDGNRYTFSELLVEVIRLCRSEGISIVFLIQRATNQMLGPDGGPLKSQIGYRAGFRATGHIELNATFNTDSRGIDLASLPDGGLYIERKGDARPVLTKAYRYEGTAVDHAARHHVQHTAKRSTHGQLDQGTAEGMEHYAGRWTRQRQQDFFMSLFGGSDTAPAATGGDSATDFDNAVSAPVERDTSDPDVAALWEALDQQASLWEADSDLDTIRAMWNADTDAAPEPDNQGAGTFMAGFQRWAESHHSGEPVTDELLQQYVDHLWNNATPEEQATFIAQNDQEWATYRDAQADSGQDELSADARELLDLLMRANLIGGDGWLPAMDIEHVATERGMWPDATNFGERLRTAMSDLGLTEENQGRKRVPLPEGKRISYNIPMLQQVAKQYLS